MSGQWELSWEPFQAMMEEFGRLMSRSSDRVPLRCIRDLLQKWYCSSVGRLCDITDPPGFRDAAICNINQSPQIQGGVAILTNNRNFPANLTNQWRRLELMSTNYPPPYFRVYYVQAIYVQLRKIAKSSILVFYMKPGGNNFALHATLWWNISINLPLISILPPQNITTEMQNCRQDVRRRGRSL